MQKRVLEIGVHKEGSSMRDRRIREDPVFRKSTALINARYINPPPKHIFLADTLYPLDIADPSQIEPVKLGWQNNSFI